MTVTQTISIVFRHILLSTTGDVHQGLLKYTATPFREHQGTSGGYSGHRWGTGGDHEKKGTEGGEGGHVGYGRRFSSVLWVGGTSGNRKLGQMIDQGVLRGSLTVTVSLRFVGVFGVRSGE